jgi:hypothetical protein
MCETRLKCIDTESCFCLCLERPVVNVMGQTHMQNASTRKTVTNRTFGKQSMDILCVSSDLQQMSRGSPDGKQQDTRPLLKS